MGCRAAKAQAHPPRHENDQSRVSALYLILGFLATAALVSAVAARARVPYTVALVVVGLGVGALPAVPRFSPGPDLIVIALIVPLLFEGAIRVPRDYLRTYAPLVLALAIPGTILRRSYRRRRRPRPSAVACRAAVGRHLLR